MPRKYTHIKVHEEKIIEMRKAGKTRKEIAKELGMGKEQIKNRVSRYNS